MSRTKNLVLEKIRKEKIKMKPKWWFVTWAAGMRGGVILAWLMAAMVMAGLWYWWDVNNPKELMGLRDLGWEVLQTNLPYWLMAELGVVVITGGILYSKVGENYKKTTKVLVLIMAGVIIGLTVLMTWLGSRNELELLLKFS